MMEALLWMEKIVGVGFFVGLLWLAICWVSDRQKNNSSYGTHQGDG
jgi:hypothetical protein